MNTDTIEGNARDMTGAAKRTAGEVLGDDGLREQGLIDQVSGKAKALFGDAKDAAAPAVDKVTTEAKRRPWATALAAGVIGMAVIGSLRGRSKA
jgi:uncharacterized protein YjbJ (UPF0337 family)